MPRQKTCLLLTISLALSVAADEWEEPLVTLQDDMEEHHDTAFWLPGDAADVNGNLCWVVHNCSISRDLREVSFETALLLNPEAVEKEPISDIGSIAHSFENHKLAI